MPSSNNELYATHEEISAGFENVYYADLFIVFWNIVHKLIGKDIKNVKISAEDKKKIKGKYLRISMDDIKCKSNVEKTITRTLLNSKFSSLLNDLPLILGLSINELENVFKLIVDQLIPDGNVVSDDEINTITASFNRETIDEIFLKKREDQFQSIQNLLKNINPLFVEEIKKSFVDFNLSFTMINFLVHVFQKTQRLSKQETKQYTSSYTTQPINFTRALTGKSDFYVKIVEDFPKENRKKILIHLPDKIIKSHEFKNYHERIIKLFDGLLEPYTCQNGIIVPYNSTDACDSISTEHVTKCLNDQHEDVDDYYILDYNEIISNLPQLMNDPNIDIDSFNKEKIEVLKNLSYLKYSVTNWNEKIEVLLSPLIHLKKLRSLEISLSASNSRFDLGALTQLKDLTIHVPTYYTDSFYNVALLETVTLSGLRRQSVLDLSVFTNAKKIIFEHYTEFKEIIISPVQRCNLILDFTNSKLSEQTLKVLLEMQAQGANVLWLPECLYRPEDHSDEPIPFRANNDLEDCIKSVFSKIDYDHYNDKITALQDEICPDNLDIIDLKMNTNLMDEKGLIPTREYRHTICTDISSSALNFIPYKFDKSDCIFIDMKSIPTEYTQNFNSQMAIQLSNMVKGSFLGKMKLSTQNELWLPLLGKTLIDELILWDRQSLEVLNNNGITPELCYVNKTRQYFIRLCKTHAATQSNPHVEITYAMQPTKKFDLTEKPACINLPADFKKALDLLKNKNKALVRLLNTHNKFKTTVLTHYCTSFERIDLTSHFDEIRDILINANITDPNIHRLMTHLIYRSGSCHIRSRVYMLLANHLNIASYVNQNSCHEFVQFFENGQWHLNNSLGGYPAGASPIIANNPWEERPYTQSTEFASEDNNEFDSFFETAIKLNENDGVAKWHSELMSLKYFSPFLQYTEKNDLLVLHENLLNQKDLASIPKLIEKPMLFSVKLL